MKKSKTFRLSDKALQTLRFIADQTGSLDTAIVEQALFFYSREVAKVVQGRQRSVDWQAARQRREAEEVPVLTVEDLNDKLVQSEYDAAVKRFPALKGMQMDFPQRKKRKRK